MHNLSSQIARQGLLQMWTVQDAKNKFSAVVDAALAGTPQEVTRRGKPAVVILSAEEYHRLLKGAVESRETFADHLKAFPGTEISRAKAVPRDVSL
jgi:antitoxin Phd